MLEGQAFPHDTKFRNSKGKIVATERFLVDPCSVDQADLIW